MFLPDRNIVEIIQCIKFSIFEAVENSHFQFVFKMPFYLQQKTSNRDKITEQLKLRIGIFG